MIQNAGRGLIIQGARGWRDYEVGTTMRPILAAAAGISARVQGMRRYHALLLVEGGKVRLIKALDGDQTLAEAEFAWEKELEFNLIHIIVSYGLNITILVAIITPFIGRWPLRSAAPKVRS